MKKLFIVAMLWSVAQVQAAINLNSTIMNHEHNTVLTKDTTAVIFDHIEHSIVDMACNVQAELVQEDAEEAVLNIYVRVDIGCQQINDVHEGVQCKWGKVVTINKPGQPLPMEFLATKVS